MLETFAWSGDIEIRQSGRGRSLRGSFPYNRLAVRSDRGRVRKERIGPRAFRFAVEDSEREINFLAGHSFDRPIASKKAGTLKLVDTDDALRFEVPELPDTPVVRQLIEEIEGGAFVAGISPGFRVPPLSVRPNAERLVPEPGNPSVQIREVNEAVLIELSVVARPSYPDTTLDLRDDELLTGEAAAIAARRRLLYGLI